jgi:N-acetylglucosaminyl-diphospho-decaprenol L-rhamnosyltransferase
VSGAAIWLRRDAIEAIEGWDEGYFMYVEDVDLCWRLRRAGWRIAYEPGGEVTHVQGVSASQHPYRMIAEHHRSLYRFATKRWRGLRRLLLLPAALFLSVRAVLAMTEHAVRRRPKLPKVTE